MRERMPLADMWNHVIETHDVKLPVHSRGPSMTSCNHSYDIISNMHDVTYIQSKWRPINLMTPVHYDNIYVLFFLIYTWHHINVLGNNAFSVWQWRHNDVVKHVSCTHTLYIRLNIFQHLYPRAQKHMPILSVLRAVHLRLHVLYFTKIDWLEQSKVIMHMSINLSINQSRWGGAEEILIVA